MNKNFHRNKLREARCEASGFGKTQGLNGVYPGPVNTGRQGMSLLEYPKTPAASLINQPV